MSTEFGGMNGNNRYIDEYKNNITYYYNLLKYYLIISVYWLLKQKKMYLKFYLKIIDKMS